MIIRLLKFTKEWHYFSWTTMGVLGTIPRAFGGCRIISIQIAHMRLHVAIQNSLNSFHPCSPYRINPQVSQYKTFPCMTFLLPVAFMLNTKKMDMMKQADVRVRNQDQKSSCPSAAYLIWVPPRFTRNCWTHFLSPPPACCSGSHLSHCLERPPQHIWVSLQLAVMTS